jgi:UDP-2,3-diacylglucosamine hydrolase
MTRPVADPRSGHTLLISDLHLSPERPAITARFLRFCRETAPAAQALWILGDLFEFWVGDDTVDEPINHDVCTALRALADAGVPVFFMAGNRDFLIARAFADASGATLVDDPVVVDLHGTPTLLMHGDTLCTDDIAYQAFRKQVRNPAVQQQFLSLPVAMRKQQVGATRAASEREKQVKANDIMDVSPDAVAEAFRTHDHARLIHGHTHRPATHEHVVDGRRCERWVLADWRDDLAEALRIDASGATRVALPLD